MPNKQTKILKNVFLSTNKNQLKLVDIYFSDRIEQIVNRTSTEIGWKEIDTVKKRKIFANQI